MTSIRVGAQWALTAPLVTSGYLLLTPRGPHRPAMLAVAAGLAAMQVVTWAMAGWLADSRLRVGLQLGGMIVYTSGWAVLSALDGGIGSPLGAALLYTTLFQAILLPPRALALMAGMTLGAYAVVAVAGPPAPAGYAVVYALGFCGAGLICHLHSRALVSLRRRLADVSRMDPLTGCLNRRGFDERVEQELAQAARTGEPLTLVLVDLDRFKGVNDTYGHRAGDDLLVWTGRILRDRLRSHDAVGRLGGDEFAVLLADTSPEAAARAVERLRADLDGCAPASLGHASWPADGTTVEQLAHVADESLYRDKLGRERTGPSAETVAAATAGSAQRSPLAQVSRRERRRRGFRHGGLMGVSNNSIGILYLLTSGLGRPHWATGVALFTLSTVVAVGLIVGAERLSRMRAAQSVMLPVTLVMFACAAVAVALDGGAGMPMAVGLLLPIPLIALGSPWRSAVPVIAMVASTYVAIGVAAGGVSASYLVMHLLAVLGVSVACGRQGLLAARRRRLLTRLSQVDVLTDALNRRGFQERFAAELAHARRTGSPLSLVLLDLDGFKQLNDTRGHAAGDELLVWVAGRLRSALHPHDAVGRLGGDEFVVLLTAGSVQPAQVAEQLRDLLAERTPTSVGAATLDADGADFDELYAHADTRLYGDKTARRRTPAEQPPVPVRP